MIRLKNQIKQTVKGTNLRMNLYLIFL